MVFGVIFASQCKLWRANHGFQPLPLGLTGDSDGRLALAGVGRQGGAISILGQAGVDEGQDGRVWETAHVDMAAIGGRPPQTAQSPRSDSPG